MIAPPRAVSGAPVGGWVGRGGGEKGVGGTEEELRGCGKRQEEPRGNKGRPSFIHQLTHTSPPAGVRIFRPPQTTVVPRVLLAPPYTPTQEQARGKQRKRATCVFVHGMCRFFSRGGAIAADSIRPFNAPRSRSLHFLSLSFLIHTRPTPTLPVSSSSPPPRRPGCPAACPRPT